MSTTQQTIYISTLIVGLLILVFLAIRAWQKYLFRGARSFLLMMFTLIGFHSFFLTTNFASSAEDRQIIMSVAFLFLELFPLTWIIMVRELAELDRHKSWRVLVPLLILNMAVVAVIAFVPGIYGFSQCFSRSGTMVFCTTNRSMIWIGLMGILVTELLSGAGYLVYHYVKNPNSRERSQILALLAAMVGVPIVTLLALVIFNDSLISPMPFSILVAGILFYNAVFNYKILSLRFSDTQSTSMVEDLLLVVNNSHIVQDFNRSTLSVFNMQVRNLVNIQLEHAFVDYPQIINLFNEERVSGNVDLVIDGVNHTFEPTVIVIMDQESGLEIGKRLQLRDISVDQAESATRENVSRDAATNLYTQEAFFIVGEKIFSYVQQSRQQMAMVVMGVDHLRRLKTRYSDDISDILLKQITEVVGTIVQPRDLLARFNNDTLVLILPFSSGNDSTALDVCSRMKRKISDHWFVVQDASFQITVSQEYTVYDVTKESDLLLMYETLSSALEKLQLEGINGLDYTPLGQREY